MRWTDVPAHGGGLGSAPASPAIRLLRRGRWLVVVSLTLVFAVWPAPLAHGQPDPALADFLAFLQGVYESAPSTADASGDQTARDGSATSNPQAHTDLDAVFAAWIEFGDPAEVQAVAEVLSGLAGGGGEEAPTVALPPGADPTGILAAGRQLQVIGATLAAAPPPTSAAFNLSYSWAEPGRPTYDGADVDNRGFNAAVFVYWDGERFVTGGHRYTGSGFEEVPTETIGLIDGAMAYVITPLDEFGECEVPTLIAGEGVFGSDSSYDTAEVPTASGPALTYPTEPEPVVETEEEPPTPASQPTAVAPATTAPVSEPASEEGGLGLELLAGILVGVAAAAVGVAHLATRRRTKGPCTDLLGAWEGAQGELARRQDDFHARQAAADEVRFEQERLQNRIVSADLMRPRPGEFEDDAAFEQAKAAHEAEVAQLEQQLEDVGPEVAAAEEAENDARQRWEQARDAEQRRRDEYLDCRERAGEPADATAPATAAPARPSAEEVGARFQAEEDWTVDIPTDLSMRRFQVITVTELALLLLEGSTEPSGAVPGTLTAAINVFGVRAEALSVSGQRHGEHGLTQDSHQDAFRHAYWSARMNQVFGSDFARRFTTAHEGVAGNEPRRGAMDLHNNEVGHRLAEANPDATPQQIADLVDGEMAAGELMVVDGDGKLAWSDQVAPGATGVATDAPLHVE